MKDAKCDNDGQPCMVHQMFFIHHLQQKICECGKKGAVVEFDRNLFAETINVIQLKKEIEHAMGEQLSQGGNKVQELKAIRSKFAGYCNTLIENSTSLCIRDQDGNVSKEVTNNPKKHRTRYMNKLQTMSEVLTFNLVWDQNPKPSDILKVLLSLPEVLNPKEIFGASTGKAKYVLKGMICFQAAHYMAFFRRIMIKYDYLETDYRTVNSDLAEMNREITQRSEWICFNDTNISAMKESWFTLLEQCVQFACYPTVLFYEKLDENEDYRQSMAFNLTDQDLEDLFNYAVKMNKQHSGNIDDIFSQEEIQR